MWRAYESIIKVIKDSIDGKKEEENKIIDYYEAVRIAYTQSHYLQKFLDKVIKYVKEINKTFNNT
jgi:hypothetical protein